MRTYVIILAAATMLFACEKKEKKATNSKKPNAGKTSAKKAKTPTKMAVKTVKGDNSAKPAAKPAGGDAEMPATPATPAEMLQDPSVAKMTAPDTFKAKFVTTKGDVVIQVTRAWSPHGADRFYTLVKIGYFTDIAFFRAVKGFMVQFGIHGDPKLANKWLGASIRDDRVVKSNTRGFVTFAKTGRPNSRSVQIFINTVDRNRGLDRMGFSPFGKVIKGLSVVDSFHTAYGEKTTKKQGDIARKGNVWLRATYPGLDYIKTASIIK